jgi:ribosomal protein S18 acetylase RimI-like enzyme
MIIRPASPATDFPGIAAVVNAFEAEPVTVATVARWFTDTAPGRLDHRRVAVNAQGEVIGYSVCVHESWSPPGRFYGWVGVLPGWRRQGVGTALYADAQAYLQAQGATQLVSEVLDSAPEALAFAQARGFGVDRHLFQSTLDLTTFDPAPYAAVTPALEAQGLRLFSLADVPNTEAMRRRAYEVNHLTNEDIPGYDGTDLSFEEFEQWVFGAEWYRADGQLLAALGDTWVGLAAVRLHPQTQGAYNVHTGVRREYRGRKIALALKLATIRYAQAHGARYMRTDNDAQNAAMLALNRKLGYQPEPGKFTLLTPAG